MERAETRYEQAGVVLVRLSYTSCWAKGYVYTFAILIVLPDCPLLGLYPFTSSDLFKSALSPPSLRSRELPNS